MNTTYSKLGLLICLLVIKFTLSSSCCGSGQATATSVIMEIPTLQQVWPTCLAQSAFVTNSNQPFGVGLCVVHQFLTTDGWSATLSIKSDDYCVEYDIFTGGTNLGIVTNSGYTVDFPFDDPNDVVVEFSVLSNRGDVKSCVPFQPNPPYYFKFLWGGTRKYDPGVAEPWDPVNNVALPLTGPFVSNPYAPLLFQ